MRYKTNVASFCIDVDAERSDLRVLLTSSCRWVADFSLSCRTAVTPRRLRWRRGPADEGTFSNARSNTNRSHACISATIHAGHFDPSLKSPTSPMSHSSRSRNSIH
ncbi:hypothetical protein EVAR_67218_1 [Eumeta japonica]|uniref:Uncharacterized protein n=1 Tax=Eumeta variegata TaxID=151549 RepID=A0A4C2A4W8_EUMVA|nr:hypothetical protein EVAR_67218_1 [Eumeta japonica]